MIGRSKHLRFLAICAASVALAFAQLCHAQEGAAGIPEKEIVALQKELIAAAGASSSTRKRRAYKNVVRDGEDLLEKSPEAASRFRVLEIIFQSQKRLLALDDSDRNREALFDTGSKLVKAPDELADLRLEADLLLSERDLSGSNADVKERAEALDGLIARYRSTPAEAMSLIMAAQIAPKLQAFELQKRILDSLGERFAGDPGVIEFRRENLGLGRLDVLFAGTFTRADGVTLRFPDDLMGRLGVMVFWSSQVPGFEAYLQQIKKQEDQFPDRFEVFSFNVDELPDAGAATLKALDLNWTVMRLPGGRKSQAYRTYAVQDPVGFLVNAFGHALLEPALLNVADQADLGVRGLSSSMSTLNRRLDEPRYLSQLQSLLVGDFLVTEPDGDLDVTLPPEVKMVSMNPKLTRVAGSVPAEMLNAIQGCFTPAPFRYRLTTSEALANYEKAERLCSEAVKLHPAAPDLWIVRNRRIIALLGMWNLAGEPKYLKQAAREAGVSLSSTLPPGADIVPRFCLAREAIRQGNSQPDSVLADLIEKTGGAKALTSAHAATAILALNANARDLYNHYRAKLLALPDGANPMLWSMLSFLRDRIHNYRLFKGNYIGKERGSVRGYMINHGGPPMTKMLPAMTLKTLDGRTLNLPEDTKGKVTLLVFVEPSAEPGAEFPVDVGEGEDKKPHHHFLQYACDLQDKHVNKGVTTIAAFLTEDVERIETLMKTRGLTCQAAIVAGGLTNPLVRRLGVLSADRIPNVFLLRRDGSIAWNASGLPYEDSERFVNLLAAKVHIETCEVETAYEALNKSDFKEAARLFSGPYLPWEPDRFGWRPPRYHGKALAYMGMEDWKAALESIEVAIEAHNLNYLRGRKRERAPNWRKDAAKVTVVNPDDILTELWNTKAQILAKLGREDEAAQIRERYAEPATPFPPGTYKAFHEKLMEWKARNENQNDQTKKN
ncbi:hypothetical protein N9A70_00960 [Akkermansiaceae bacterium]|nr:hypothetical protein [Akkermansiaceae bacterium]MDA7929230.1 hypothetical protein [Akkermansiaceae bacterium]